jgi:hypothetical protein
MDPNCNQNHPAWVLITYRKRILEQDGPRKADKRRSLGQYSSLADSDHGVI